MIKKKIFSLFLSLVVLGFCAQMAKSVEIKENDGIYQVRLQKGRKLAKRLKCVVVDDLMTVREAHKRSGAILTVNGGFFDPKNKKSVSYVIEDGHMAADPIFNENLFTDGVVRKNMDKILNRSEFRILECFKGFEFEIAQHKSPVNFECQVMNSIQGGPLVYPQLQLEEEFFVLKDEDGNVIRESASVLHRVPRTIIALKDNSVYFLIFSDEHPATLEEVSEYCAKNGFDRAMALDGGGSTSMNYLNSLEIVSKPENGQGRAVKSLLMLMKK